jgi:hypothetical protein
MYYMFLQFIMDNAHLCRFVYRFTFVIYLSFLFQSIEIVISVINFATVWDCMYDFTM